jgi:hypothetical protein
MGSVAQTNGFHSLNMGCCNNNFIVPSLPQIVHGAVSVIKTQLHIGLAPREIMVQRALICSKCVHKTHVIIGPMKFCQCDLCKCLVSEKVKRTSESCPIGLWSASVPSAE